MESSFIQTISVLEKETLGSVKIAIPIFGLYCVCCPKIQVSAASLKSRCRNDDSC